MMTTMATIGSSPMSGLPWPGVPMAVRNGRPGSRITAPEVQMLIGSYGRHHVEETYALYGLRDGALRLGRPDELPPEGLEGSKRYSVPDPFHGVKVKAQIMQRVKGPRRHLAGHEQVPQIRT